MIPKEAFWSITAVMVLGWIFGIVCDRISSDGREVILSRLKTLITTVGKVTQSRHKDATLANMTR